MNKKVLIGIVIIVIIFILVAAIKILVDINGSNNSIINGASKITDKISYEVHNNYKEGSFDYTKRGYYINTMKMPNAPWFYIISMGERNTGGYSINISDVKIDDSNNVKVIVKESGPAAGDMVTMAFTYPTVCLELNKKPNSIEITNTNGEVFKELH